MAGQRSQLAFVVFLISLLFASTFEQRTDSPSIQAEKLVLLQLRSSLGLKSKDWPIKGDPCSTWNGIRCENGSVVGINISGFGRTRIGKQKPQFAVESLVNLTRLVSFNASKFLLPGSIPGWFGQRFLTLQVLDLSSCSITGFVPASLGNLTNLRILNLSGNSLSGSTPASLGQLSSLSMLDLSKNSLNGSIPFSFSSLGNISILDLSSNFLTGSIPLFIGTLLKLQHLNLSNNFFSSSMPPQLGDLDELVDLDLSHNLLSGSVPADLRELRNLQKFIIGNNRLSGSLPDNLFPVPSQLLVVVFRENSFTGGLPHTILSLPALLFLDLSGNNFTDTLPNSTPAANVTVAELNLSGNMFYGGLMPMLRRFKVVDLSENFFEGKVPDFMLSKALLSSNCLQNVTDQRTLQECSSFYSQKDLVFDNFGRPAETLERKSSGLSRRTVVILAAVAGGIVLILIFILLPVLVARCIRKNNRATTLRGNSGMGPIHHNNEISPPPPGSVSVNFSNLGDSFTYQQLLTATNKFNEANLITKGHSGDVFKGILETGIMVVIKRIDLESARSEAYLTELDIFSRVSHPRLVPLLGHCLENVNQKFLVYKYMPTGDLSSSLFKKLGPGDDSEGLKSLDWITRLKIALGAAEGLSYLHHERLPPIVHRDVQASSILLDDKFEVRIGSLSEACVQEGDGRPSRISRLMNLPRSSQQSSSGSSTTATCDYDVYCFGKVLLELVTGKLGISSFDETQTRETLDEILQNIDTQDKEPVRKILDPSLIVDEDLLEEVWAMAIIARSCLNPKPSRRPLMRHIVLALENPLRVVREDSAGSGRLRADSSRRSWNGGIFGSWRRSSSDAAVSNPPSQGEGFRKPGVSGSSRGSSSQNDRSSSSRRRQMKEIVPEPVNLQDA